MDNWREHADTLARGCVPILCEARTRIGETKANDEMLAEFWRNFSGGKPIPTDEEILKEAESQKN